MTGTFQFERLQDRQQKPHQKAIELFDAKYAKEYPGDDIYKVYDLLQQEHKAATFAVMAEARQAGWLRYELAAGWIHD
jgi:hypothetical protein